MAFTQSIYCNDSISSKIVIYREYNYQGSAVSYKVFVGDSTLVKLKNNSYYEYSCLPGEYGIQIGNFKETKMNLKVEQNKTYYLRFGLRTGVWSAIPELLLVDSISAYPVINSGSIRKLDEHNTPMIRPKNRFGLNLNGGFGFESTPMLTTIDGRESTISFGGGYAIGLKYGYEITKHLDLAIDLNYQVSDLNPNLRNADVSFRRGIISVTPSYIIPIDGGDAMRIKLGAGLDRYIGSELSLDLSELIWDFKEKWSYKSSLGYHVNAIFELNVSENWSFNYGLKWYNVAYTFKKGNNYYPTEQNLESPNGSGIDFLFGLYYHF